MGDELVQQAIRTSFSQCTVLTIAHRLNTIIDSDRIMCLSKGKVENFGRPLDLIKDRSSVLYELINSLDVSEKNHLIRVAKQKEAKGNGNGSDQIVEQLEKTSNASINEEASDGGDEESIELDTSTKSSIKEQDEEDEDVDVQIKKNENENENQEDQVVVDGDKNLENRTLLSK